MSRVLALVLVLVPVTACSSAPQDSGSAAGAQTAGTPAANADAFNPADAAELPTGPDESATGSATEIVMVDCAPYRGTAAYAFGSKLAAAVTTPEHVAKNPDLYLSQVGATLAIEIGHYEAACGMAETNNRLGREHGWAQSCWPRQLCWQGLCKACPEPGDPNFFAGCINCSTDPPRDQVDPGLRDTPGGK